MTITMHNVVLKTTQPDLVTPLDGVWTLRVLTLGGTLINTETGDVAAGSREQKTTAGVTTFVLPAIPQSGIDPSDATYQLVFQPAGHSGSITTAAFQLDGDKTLKDLTSETGLPITPSILEQAIAARDAAEVHAEHAAADRAAVEAIGTTTDAVIAGRLGDPLSLTSGAVPEALGRALGVSIITDPQFGGPVAGDWQPAIQNALNHRSALGGGLVYAPAGIYSISNPCLLPLTAVAGTAPPIWFAGAGMDATIIQKNGVIGNVTFTAATDTATTPAPHGLVVGDSVRFGTVTTTTGVEPQTIYYVKTIPTPTTFTLAATSGGATIDLVGDGTATGLTHTFKGITNDNPADFPLGRVLFTDFTISGNGGEGQTFTTTDRGIDVVSSIGTDSNNASVEFHRVRATKNNGESLKAAAISVVMNDCESYDNAGTAFNPTADSPIDSKPGSILVTSCRASHCGGSRGEGDMIEAVTNGSQRLVDNSCWDMSGTAGIVARGDGLCVVEGNTVDNWIPAQRVLGNDGTATITASSDTITTPRPHGLALNRGVKFTGIVTTTGIVAGTTYYVKTIPTPTTFTLAATSGGATIDLVGDGSLTGLVEVDLVSTSHTGILVTRGNAVWDGTPEYIVGNNTVRNYPRMVIISVSADGVIEVIGKATIIGNNGSNLAREAVWVQSLDGTLKNIAIIGNNLTDVGQEAHNTYDLIRIGAAASTSLTGGLGVVDGVSVYANRHRSPGANKPKYMVRIDVGGGVSVNDVVAQVNDFADWGTAEFLDEGGTNVKFNPLLYSQPVTPGGTAYTLALADVVRTVVANQAVANTITVPTDATAAIPIGTSIPITSIGSVHPTIAAAAGATLLSRGSVFQLAGVGAMAAVYKYAANSWILTGDLV